jgi:hypothetical protein
MIEHPRRRFRRSLPSILAASTLLLSASNSDPRTRAQDPEVVTTSNTRQLRTVSIPSFGPDARIDIAYGAPQWREEYTTYLTSHRDRHLRLGRDAWSTCTTSAHLRGPRGFRLATGSYALGLRRTASGEYSLTFTDLGRLLARGTQPGRTRQVVEDAALPLSASWVDTEQPLLEVECAANGEVEDGRAPLRMTLRWGPMELRGEFDLLDRPDPRRRPRFEPRPDPTASGLVTDIENPGRPPAAPYPDGARFEVAYTIWSRSHSVLDSTHERDDTITATLDRLHPDWAKLLPDLGIGGRVRIWTADGSAVIDLVSVDW